MAWTADDHTAPTRRDYVKFSGAIVGGGLLAGCTNNVGSGSTPTEISDKASYEVCLPDRYCITFESVPETWGAGAPAELEMGLLLGQSAGFIGMLYPSYPTPYYDALGLDLDTESKTRLLDVEGQQASVDKEVFYEADADVYLIDPNTLPMYSSSWTEADTQEIAENVGPFVGHHGYHTPATYMGYEPWPLMEYFQVVSEVFQERERYEAAEGYHDDLRKRIRSQLPDKRPTVAMVGGSTNPASGSFHPVAIEDGGWGSKPYRDAGARDAFTDLDASTTSIDYEVLLETDPDVIVYQNRLGPGGLDPMGDEAFRTDYLEPMRASIGKNLTAVQNGTVYPGAPHIQGPITTIFGMEAAAKQLYPETFTGELFDREGLATLVRTEN